MSHVLETKDQSLTCSENNLRLRFTLVPILIALLIVTLGGAHYQIKVINDNLLSIQKINQEQLFLWLKIDRVIVNNSAEAHINARDIAILTSYQDSIHHFNSLLNRQMFFDSSHPLPEKLLSLSVEEIDFVNAIGQNNSAKEQGVGVDVLSQYWLDAGMDTAGHWQTRLSSLMSTIDLQVDRNSKSINIIILVTYMLVVFSIFALLVKGILPVVNRLLDSARYSQDKLDVQVALSQFLEDISTDRSLLHVNKLSLLSEALNKKISGHKVLSKINLSLTDKADGIDALCNKNVIIETVKRPGSRAYYLICTLPTSLNSVHTDIRPFVSALSQHLYAIFELKLRLEAESQRDVFFQIADITMNALPNPIAVFDNRHNVTLINPSFLDFFKIPCEEKKIKTSLTLDIIKNCHQSLLTPDTYLADDPFSEGEAMECSVNYKNHEAYAWSRLPVADLGYVVVGHNITKIRKELVNKDHQKRLEYVGKISASVAHDTNNFLSVIMTSLELIAQSDELNADNVVLLDEAMNSCVQASRIGQQLLSLSRRQNLLPQRINPHDLYNKVKLFLSSEGYHEVNLSESIDYLQNIYADPVFLESAILNIVKNSIEAMNCKGSIHIEILSLNNEKVQIIISDNGPGFTEESFDHATEPFYTSKEEGTGLGLSTVMGFAKQSNGALSIENKNGAKIILELPKYQSKNETVTKGKIKKLPIISDKNEKTILFVDDNLLLSELISTQLRGKGYNVLSATSVREAKDVLIKEDVIDVIISDVNLADGFGFEVMKEAKLKHSHAIVIYITGYGFDRFEAQFNELPGYVLQKPFSIKTLLDYIASSEVTEKVQHA